MSRPVILTPQAEAHIRRIDAWWRTNRTASPELFVQELADALSTLELVPGELPLTTLAGRHRITYSRFLLSGAALDH